MGAAICCAEDGGEATDDWTTCETDRDLLLDRQSLISFFLENTTTFFTTSTALLVHMI